MSAALPIIAVVAVLVAIVVVIIGVRMPQSKDPIQERLSELMVSEEAMTLEELELSQDFAQRIVVPFFNRIGQLAQRFTPQ
ncbi:MAG TPA: hypothetical protein VI729_08475, partial [Anaerolineales bacterium]|nr:hypothetical protein [Anaerolineales bacterium]